MQLTDWLSSWWSARKPTRRRSRHGKPASESACQAKVAAEFLEQRMMPAVITVTSLADTIANDGQVTLREAIQAANTDTTVDGVTGSGADTIQFAPALTASGPATITLGGTQLAITSNLTIKGPGTEKLTIDGDNRSRIFAVDDGTSTKINVEISGLAMAKGKVVSDRGGAILNRETLTVASSTIRNSTANYGGSAIRGEQGELTISQSTIRDNSGGRGAISVFQGTLTVTQSTISGNSTDSYGGGIDIVLTATTVSQSTIVGNSAHWKGGGILNDAGQLTVVQSTIVSNYAGEGGGGGGGIYTFSGSHLTLHNTILINNTTVGGQANDLGVYSGQLASAKSNLIGDPLSAGGLTHGVNGNIIGADNGSGGRVRLNAASVLATTLADNGGPTKTLTLVSGSPAINAGDNSLIPADVRDLDGDGNLTEAVPFDQRGSGFGRIASGLVDIGASEFGAVALQMFDLAPGVTSSYPERFQNIDGTLLFNAKDGPGKSKLWLTDGTAAGTMLAPELRPGIKGPTHDNFATLNGISYFAASDSEFGVELWKTDGTAAGTLRVIDLNPGSAGSDISGLVNMNGTLYFNANDGIHGLELWKSDGTAAGTSLVKDIAPGTNLTLNSSHSAPAGLTVFNGTLYFSAKTAAEGRELWKSDGTADGTVLIKDISPGTENSVLPSRFLELNGALYFVAGDAATGQELWKTDGTAEGTTVVRDIRTGSTGSGIQPPVIFNGELFFGADDGVHGYELWRSDGTTAGTTLVKDLFPGGTSSNVSSFVVHEGRLYFGAWESSDVRSLWMSDGTAEGTVSLRDLAPELANRQTAPEASYNGQLFFRADSVSQGIELWVLTGQPEVVAPIGTVSIAATNASRLEGNSGSLGFTFTVTRTDSTRSASVNYAVTGSGSNPANAEDFGGALPSGKISFVAGETTKTITINVSGDTTVEPNEGFTVTLSNSVGTSLGAVSASGLIRNDDSSLSIAATSADQFEGNSGATAFIFTVTRTGTSSGAASVDYAVTDSGANAANAADFGGTLPSGTINFAAGETSKTVTINVRGDSTNESDETFTVTLSNPIGANLGTTFATGTIFNDDFNVSLDDSGNLRIRDLAAGGRVDQLTVSFDADSQEVVISDRQNSLTSSLGTIVDAHEIRVARAAITGNELRVELNGGADQLDLSQLPAGLLTVEVDGGDGADTIIGHTGADLIVGGLGNDSISGGAGNDTLLGGKGNDVLNGEDGDDSLCGQTQNDRLIGGDGDDTCDGGGGDDSLTGDAGNDRLSGTTGNDVISGGDGRDKIFGGGGHDSLEGNSGNDQINGSSGNDTIDGGGGNDFLEGQVGNDLIKGSSGNDTLQGGLNDDTLIGLSGHDRLEGNEGHDVLKGSDGNDTLLGGSGNDNLSGSVGDDSEEGGEGDDTVAGGDGNDSLTGGDGNDLVKGDAGDDSLDGGAGNDVISGDLGEDVLIDDEDDDLIP